MLRIKKGYLSLNDWTVNLPYEEITNTDRYYYNLAKKVYSIVQDSDYYHLLFGVTIDNNLYKYLACTLTGYFEDVCSELGLWKSLVDEHKRRYGAYVPFYKTGDEYYHGEINLEDIQFLLWYHLSLIYHEEIFNPLDIDILRLANEVFDLFEEEYEYAPTNSKLKEFLHLPEDTSDYYLVRNKLEWVVYNSHMFRLQKQDLLEEVEERRDQEDFQEENYSPYFNNQFDIKVINAVTPFFGLRSNNIYALMLGKNHPCYKSLNNLSERKTSMFIFKDHDENYAYLEQISTGKIIQLTQKSINDFPNFSRRDKMLLLGLVNWMEEWWFSGAMASFESDKKILEETQKDPNDQRLFEEDAVEKKKVLDEQYQFFLKSNNNKQIVFLSSESEAEEFTLDFIINWNKTRKLPKAEIKAANKFLLEKKSRILPNGAQVECIIFFNQNSGMELLGGYNDLVPDPMNPWYDPNCASDEFIDIIKSKDCSSELIKYIVETYDLENIQFTSEDNNTLVLDNLDFLLSFWKREKYLD